ncbi:unnamed protein product [Clonostachys rhizophaga]|uniref:Uncharacterized protein n=1 Tax=Clonostachys rhizophaga TaxID=160324 RepID=A0A9N9YLC9_9HYPO|nr:unnamed protein product [Clonostachys rhizophaga]
MRWVEVLIHKLYKNDSSSSLRILKPDRWVKRQHNGSNESPQARFMQPLCDPVPNEVDTSSTPIQEQDNADKDVVLFMPYLHWDEEKAYIERNTVIENHGQCMDDEWTKEQKLLHQYVYDKSNHPLHLMHTRRTLDQFYYHSLKSTKKRDGDQAVSRYQTTYFPNKPKIIAVADQLWLWVLVGPSKRAQAVISCFPSKQASDLTTGESRDPAGKTEVLQKIKHYLPQEPQTVRNPYDLVGVIASMCSRAFLDSSIPPTGLRFADVYESSISNIMNEEAELFDDFNATLDLRSTVTTTTREMLETLRELKSRTSFSEDRTFELKRTLMKYNDDTKAQEIAMDKDINAILKSTNPEFAEEAARFLQMLIISNILDITREIGLLRKIKDIQDELSIISMLNFLVDLKQKQSNVMDARATRIQAQASYKMTLQSEKQGKVLLIFTVTTIVFLPLSFMAAFFAINITEFQRDAGGTLGLGYVSDIMCEFL